MACVIRTLKRNAEAHRGMQVPGPLQIIWISMINNMKILCNCKYNRNSLENKRGLNNTIPLGAWFLKLATVHEPLQSKLFRQRLCMTVPLHGFDKSARTEQLLSSFFHCSATPINKFIRFLDYHHPWEIVSDIDSNNYGYLCLGKHYTDGDCFQVHGCRKWDHWLI